MCYFSIFSPFHASLYHLNQRYRLMFWDLKKVGFISVCKFGRRDYVFPFISFFLSSLVVHNHLYYRATLIRWPFNFPLAHVLMEPWCSWTYSPNSHHVTQIRLSFDGSKSWTSPACFDYWLDDRLVGRFV